MALACTRYNPLLLLSDTSACVLISIIVSSDDCWLTAAGCPVIHTRVFASSLASRTRSTVARSHRGSQ